MALTLKEAITATQTTIDVNGTDPLSNGDLYAIENEQVYIVTASTGSVQPGQTAWQRLTVQRGQLGTTEAAHTAGTAVTLVETPLGAGGLPEWFVADEENQTFDFFGGFHLHSTDDPNDPGDVSVTIDGRDSAGNNLISLTPVATNKVGLHLDMPNGQTAKPLIVEINNTERLRINNNGTLVAIPGGVNIMLQVNSGDVVLGGTTLYVDASTVAFFGANGSAQHVAIPDATDAATTMAKLNLVLQLLRDLGLVAAA